MTTLKGIIPFLSILTLLGLSGAGHASAIFAPGDTILGGASDGTHFLVGTSGFDPGENEWPDFEGPEHMIDGVGQKYLNFAGDESGMAAGAIVTPSGGSSVAGGITFWTANDAIPRDPASFQLFGTNALIIGDPLLSIFDLIAAGDIALPDSRNGGGGSPLLDENSLTVSFANTDAYTSYLVLFPTLKDAASANSMQIAEVQLHHAVPEPSTVLLLGVGLAGLGFARKRQH